MPMGALLLQAALTSRREVLANDERRGGPGGLCTDARRETLMR